jgi:FKBP-type peptidyl-prolyl cis-trans isomerase
MMINPPLTPVFFKEHMVMSRVLGLGLMAAVSLVSASAFAAKPQTEPQKLGYIIGMDIGASLKTQGSEIDLDSLFDAIRTTYTGGTAELTPEEAATIREAFIAQRRAAAEADQAKAGAANAAAGEKFLLENRSKEGVVVTESGLQYKVVKVGEGPKPTATDKVTVHYKGTLLNGEEFDSSYARGEPVNFVLNQVIPGWTEGVQLMPVGSTFIFYIPANLAYGPAGGGPIGPSETLTFQVELIGIGDKQ